MKSKMDCKLAYTSVYVLIDTKHKLENIDAESLILI